MRDVAGVGPTFDFYCPEILNTAIGVTIEALADVAAGVSERLAPGVIHVEQQPLAQALLQRRLQAVVVRPVVVSVVVRL